MRPMSADFGSISNMFWPMSANIGKICHAHTHLAERGGKLFNELAVNWTKPGQVWAPESAECCAEAGPK